MKTEPTEEKYRAETCSSPIGETGDYDSWIELVTPDFNLQCYDPDIDFEQVEELAKLLNKAASYPNIKQLEWDFHGTYYSAETPVADYMITQENDFVEDDDDWVLWVNGFPISRSALEEAKSTAQAEFEKRVMECLDL